MPTKKDNKLPPGIVQLDEKGKLFAIQYTDARGNRRREKAGTYRMAEDLLLHRKIEVLQHRLPGIRNRIGFKMDELIDDAINYAARENDWTNACDMKLKLERIRLDFGKKDASSVTRQHIIDWLDKQAIERSWKPASRNRYQSAYSMLFRLAVEANKLDISPVVGIKRKQEPKGRIRFLSRAEEDRLVAAIRELYPQNMPMFMLALHTGMRHSEQFRSQVGDYDEETGMFMVRQTKNKRGPDTRYVPLTPIGVSAYKELCAGREIGELLCEDDSTRYWFEKCLEQAGIIDFTWHTLRHTFISRLVMAGVPIAAVSQYAGHTDIATTMIYSHLIPEQNKVAIEKLMAYYA